MIIKVVDHNSEGYWKAVKLRREVLRYPLGLDYTDEQLAAEGNETHIVIECGDETIAYLMATKLSDDLLQIRQVAVDNKLQGQGIGSKIMEFAENWASKSGYSEVLLHSRGYAVPFYKKIGYVGFGDEFEEVGIPHLKMRKPLAVSK
jgi:predicted GNAT family N-acyltransferase